MPDIQPIQFRIAEQTQASQPEYAISSWWDLSQVPTLNLPTPVVKIWVQADTGQRRTVRLLPSQAETDLAAGIQRPADFDPQLNARCWFLAG